jgi:hypothetical protein
VVSTLVKQFTGGLLLQSIKPVKTVKLLNPDEEKFLSQLSEAAGSMMTEPLFNSEELGRKLGLSKSQLYR